MPHYFYLMDAGFYRQRLQPALAASWQGRSFDPCRELCTDLLPAVRDFQQRFHASEEWLIPKVVTGLAFDRHFWRLLAGELMLAGAVEIPDIEISAATLDCLMNARPEPARARLAPIQQVHHGTHDLVFGSAIYRPDHAGWNDPGEVRRLHEYLQTLNPQCWTSTALMTLPDMDQQVDREEELAFVKDWFPELVNVYRRAAERGNIIICES